MAMTFNISKYIVALAVVSMTVASCSREEDHIWEQSAAERLDAARSADLEILCAATNGWEMLYFTESDFRGVNFLLKFADNGSVTVATRNADTGNAYQEETSAYDVITDDGPVLSFNTYNSLLHRYADPDPDQTQQTDGVGEGGDYEFKIMSISSDLIYLRGKKHGVDIYMYPLEAGADWQQYFADVYANHEKMFDTSIPQLWLTLADGKRFSISNATVQVYDPSSPTPVDASRSYVTDQVMAFVPEGGDALTETKNMSYIVTRKGIRWMQAFPGDTLTTTPAREFVWNDEGTYLARARPSVQVVHVQGGQAANGIRQLFGRLQPLQNLPRDLFAVGVVPVVLARFAVGGGLAHVVQEGGKAHPRVRIFARAQGMFEHVVRVEIGALGHAFARRKLGQDVI